MIAVSPWVAARMKKRHGLTCEVIYSPVPGDFPQRALADRDHTFVCLGRLSPEKRIEDILLVLERVRAKGHDVRLRIIGGADNLNYAQVVAKECARRSDWIKMEGRLHGEEKAEVLSSCRFAIHACHGDAFPGALIEMMKAGCIPWAHRSGGQVDILQEDDLLYGDVDEAVAKIHRILLNPARQRLLQKELRRRAERYSVEHYESEIRALLARWINA